MLRMPPARQPGEAADFSGNITDELTKTIASRGDLARLALFLWASGASGSTLSIRLVESEAQSGQSVLISESHT
jgi:hypothetical protein